MSQLINFRGEECPKCGHSDFTLCNRWPDNYTEIYCDRCTQHYASEDYDEPLVATETPRRDVRDVIVRQLLQGNSNPFEHDEEQWL